MRFDHIMKHLPVGAMLALLACFVLPVRAAALETGQSAPAFELRYEGSRVLRSVDLAGSVVVITCESKDTIGINQPFKDALLKAFPESERELLKIAVVPVVACFQYPWPGKGMCARGVQDSVAQVNLQLYVDMSGEMFASYGASADTSTVLIIDRAGVVRSVMRGKIPDGDVGSVVELIRALAQTDSQTDRPQN